MENFKIVEVKGYTRAEAVEKAPFKILKDATQAWKSAGSPIGKELKDFCANYLQKNTKFAEGLGCSITATPGAPDTRERPYKVTDVVNKKGKRKYTTGIQLTDSETGEVLFTTFDKPAKESALKKAKELYTEYDYRGTAVAEYVRKVTEGEPKAFEINYQPSISAKVGNYIAFGVEA